MIGAPFEQRGRWRVPCVCACGKRVEILRSSLLRAGRPTRSCGCLQGHVASAQSRKPLRRGERFGRLTVIRSAGVKAGLTRSGLPFYISRYICRCDCGTRLTTQRGHLVSGHTASCGCHKREATRSTHTTHGMSSTPTFNSWAAMQQRCYNKNARPYYLYGGRGIGVCQRWRDSFAAFLADLGPKPGLASPLTASTIRATMSLVIVAGQRISNSAGTSAVTPRSYSRARASRSRNGLHA